MSVCQPATYLGRDYSAVLCSVARALIVAHTPYHRWCFVKGSSAQKAPSQPALNALNAGQDFFEGLEALRASAQGICNR